ncbi:MAG: S8 family serine peptidase [Planctomycetota bacterium]|jgi:subtilisin family serine protease
MKALLVGALLCVVLAGSGESRVPADAASRVKIHRSVDRLLAEQEGAVLVWVFFEDKGLVDIAQAIRGLEQTYNPRAIQRRRLRRTAPGLFDERDLPVCPDYVDAVMRTGAELRTASRWVNGVSVLATKAQVRAIAALPSVSKIQPVRRIGHAPPPGDHTDVAPPAGGAASGAGSFYGLSEEQLAQINVIALHEQGYTGSGVIIGALDTGFTTTHEAFNYPGHPLQVVAAYDFLNDDPNVGIEPGDHPDQHQHGTQVLGTMGAYNPGVLVGSAYDAGYILTKVEEYEFEYPAEEYLFVAGLEFIEANGGDVATSSVVLYDYYPQDQLDGLTSVMTIGINTATANGVHCCQGVGNQGHDSDPVTSTLLPPADGFQVITVGSVDSAGASAWFTSDGPTADGRVKPEVLARGVLTRTIHAYSDTAYQEVNGASFATPTTAGAVACVVQAHPEWTVDQMRWALIHTADYYIAHGTHDPLYIRGYGISDFLAASSSPPPRPGDLDGDGVVGILDFLAMLARWGPCPDPCPPHCLGDVDTDCTVGIEDFLILLANWG